MIHLKTQLEERNEKLNRVNRRIEKKLSKNNLKLKKHFTLELEILGNLIPGSKQNWSISKPAEGIKDIGNIIQCVRDFFPKAKLNAKFKASKVTVTFDADSVMADPFTFINFTGMLVAGMTPIFDDSKLVIPEAMC